MRKDIEGYKGLYKVSNRGVIRSIGNDRTKKTKTLRHNIIKSGYSQVKLIVNNVIKSYYVHRLVAQTFIPNPENKLEINHKDGNKLNNCIENLEWCTHKDNMKHCYKILGFKGSHYGKFGKHHSNSKAVLQYDLEGNFIREWDSMMDVQREQNIKQNRICECCSGKLKTTGGYIWKLK